MHKYQLWRGWAYRKDIQGYEEEENYEREEEDGRHYPICVPYVNVFELAKHHLKEGHKRVLEVRVYLDLGSKEQSGCYDS